MEGSPVLPIVRLEDLVPYEGRSAKGGNDNRYEMRDFFGSPQDDTAGPQVFLVDLKTPHGVVKPHFHPEDQFQVFARGTGLIGKTPVRPTTLHYVDGYKAYGPITADDEGIAFFTVRMRPTKQTHFMPESRRLMQPRTVRPQLVFQFPDEQPGFLHGPCDDGLAVERRVVPAGEPVELAAPPACGGQIVFVVAGSLVCGAERYERWSCAHVVAGSRHEDLRAGPDGLELMVLQFPVQRGSDALDGVGSVASMTS